MSDDAPWPPPPDPTSAELSQVLYQAQVDEARQNRRYSQPGGRIDADIALEKADWDKEFASERSFEQAIVDVLTSAVDRAKSRAELIEKAAASIAVIYSGVLGLSFSVTDKPLPLRGIVPALFLGLSIVLAMVYLTYLTRVASYGGTIPLGQPAEQRLGYLSEWISRSIMTRVSFLRAAVVSLGIGVLCLPLPFVHFPNDHSPQASTSVAWPSPPSDVANPDLAKILYQAQVDEAKAERAKPASVNPGGDNLVWVILAAGLTLVVAVPLGTHWVQRLEATHDKRQQGPRPPEAVR